MICRECEPTIDTAQRYTYRGINKFGYRDKWKKYIEVVLDDMEKEKECE